MATREQRMRVAGPGRVPQLRYVRTLDCDADRLWSVVTRPGLLSQWLGATIMSDAQYGGFTVSTGVNALEPGQHTDQQTGMVTTCVPPHYFQATWDAPPHQPSTVLVDVVPGAHDAHLILTHGGLPQDLVESYDMFWTTALNRLHQFIGGRLPAHPARWQIPPTAGGA
ncbi:SRPBCC domain-containing protein [Kribbella hippodromi]